ncbi:MAG: adenosylhomocysteine nucleosidase [Actinomycetota bacterium]|nr:adenosylhomocysteine nucleosidase [Actinomycetota bacterium]
MSAAEIVFLTALNLEYQAVREHLTDLRLRRHEAGTRFEVGRITDTGTRAALVLVGKGNHPAAVLAERAIAEFSPSALVFVGVAGALRAGITLGDVIVATHVYAYHGGTSQDDGLKARPRVWEIPHGADQIARHLERTGEWKRRRRTDGDAPQVRFGPIAAGEVVQDSTSSEHARWVRQHYNDALAIEMESAGVAQAAHLNRALPVVVVRGISDRADGSKNDTDRQLWQPRAVADAAAFAVALAQELAMEETRPKTPKPTGTGRAAVPSVEQGYESTSPVTPTGRGTMDGGTQNIATGNSQVGLQAGTIYGDIRIGAAAVPGRSPQEELAVLRTLLARAHDDARIDDPTYCAARSELRIAEEALRNGKAQDRSAASVALKRLRGLVGNITDLATKVAAVLSLIEGVSR